MDRILLAQVDWVFLAIAGIVLLMLATWPLFRRLARETNLAFAEGDMARSLDAALRLRRSWLPQALLQRLLDPGRSELIIAERYRLLADHEEAVRWCEAGLRKARKPATRMLLHGAAAFACSQHNQMELSSHHLQAAQEIARRRPSAMPEETAGYTDASAAITCYLRAGRVREAMESARQAFAQLNGPPSPSVLQAALAAMLAAGQFEAVLRSTAWLIDEPPAGPPGGQPPPSGITGSLGIDQFRQAVQNLQEATLLLAGADAARHAGRWELVERFAQRLLARPTPWPATELLRMGRLAILSAHHGRRDAVADLVKSMESVTVHYPRDRRLRNTAAMQMAEAWQTLGDHELALAAAATADPQAMSPLDGSELAALTARSLAAIEQYEQAHLRQAEAHRLAPYAYWNRSPAETTLADGALPTEVAAPTGDRVQSIAPAFEAATLNPPVETFRPALIGGPIERLASGAACAAWVLAVFAFMPLAGSLAAIALLVLAIVLLARSRPLQHDRRTGWAALAIALLALGLSALTIVHLGGEFLPGFMTARARHIHVSELPAGTQPAEAEDEDESAASAPSSDEGLPAAPAAPALEKAAPATRPGGVNRTRLTDSDTAPGGQAGEGQREEQEPLSTSDKHKSAEFALTWRQHAMLLAVLILSIMLHEIGHAVAALWSGDPTVRDRGRISLNPLRHVDPVGSIIVPGVLMAMNATVIGWARPVPVRPDRYRHSRRGQLAVSLAGVSLNLMLALLATRLLTATAILLCRLYPDAPPLNFLNPFESNVSARIPCATAWALLLGVCKASVFINTLLMAFNLLPIPPLDGYGVVRAIVPRAIGEALGKLGGFATVGLMLLIAFNLLTKLLMPAFMLSAILLGLAYVGAYGGL